MPAPILAYHLDLLVFGLLAIVAMAVVHLWIAKGHRGGGFAWPAWALLVGLVLGGGALAHHAGEQEQSRLQARLQGVAPTYALELARAGHARLRLDTPPDDSLYLDLIEREKSWLRANPAVSDIYTFRRGEDGSVVLVLDSETDYDRNGVYQGEREARTEIGEPYPSDPMLERAFAGEAVFDPQPVTDRWGTWVSAYVPMVDGAGQVEAVLGVDYSAGDWQSAILRARAAVLGFTGLIVVALVGTMAMVTLARAELDRRSKAEHALRESEARFRTLADGAPVMIWLEDVDRQCVYLNQAWLGFTGRTFEQESGEGWMQGMHPDDREPYLAAVNAAWQHRAPFAIEYRMKRADAELRWLHENGAPRHDADGTFAGYVGVCFDLTDRKEAAAELARPRDEALASARLKSEFLANMSHEIRTPMNGVLGMLGLLLETGLTAEQRDQAELAHQSAESLLTVINDILDFSKIESGRLTVEPVAFDLSVTVDEAADLLAMAAERKGVELVVRYDAAAPRHLIGDAGRIRQILTNLIGNAVKFTPQGHVLVQVAAAARTAEDAVLEIAVQDTGIGIAPDLIPIIFDKFTQGDTSTTRRFGGTGLGLAISRQLAELMGGTLNVQSLVGVGSIFTLRLPLRLGEAPKGESMDLRGIRVLVVDDVEINRRVLLERLAGWGCRASASGSAIAGLTMLRDAAAAGDPFRVALLDHHMPDVDGETLGRLIRAEAGIAATALIMLSSACQRGDPARIRAAGIDRYLVKPVRTAHLREAMTSVTAAKQPAPLPEGDAIAVREVPGEGRIRALVAEDNPVNQKVAARMLQRLACRVDLASNGLEAVEMAARFPFDIVFMDCQMPEMDGLEATAAIRASENGGPRMPIVAMTAHVLAGDRERCLAGGMDDYIGKPVTPGELARVLSRWVGGSAAATG